MTNLHECACQLAHLTHLRKFSNFGRLASLLAAAAMFLGNHPEDAHGLSLNASPPLPPPPPPQTPPDLSGTWTIYAYNVNQPGSSLKTMQIVQQGNIISGTFHGPHQHGKMQGFVNGNHVEFSTDTHDVLTFRGEITSTGMSGMYGVHGEHAQWTAERTN